VGEAALPAGVALTELRPAGSGGLEQLFLTLTATGGSQTAGTSATEPTREPVR
ncbi:ABC transporter ATP-binding protein, partial [Verrucosispora sp. SN26_14.1]